LLKDPDLRQRMGEAGLTRAREHFSAERMVKETAKVYALLRHADHARATS